MSSSGFHMEKFMVWWLQSVGCLVLIWSVGIKILLSFSAWWCFGWACILYKQHLSLRFTQYLEWNCSSLFLEIVTMVECVCLFFLLFTLLFSLTMVCISSLNMTFPTLRNNKGFFCFCFLFFSSLLLLEI